MEALDIVTTSFSKHWIGSESFFLTALYIIAQKPLRTYFRDGKHYEENKSGWKKVMFSYNIAMSVFSFICFFGCGMVLWQYPLFTNKCESLFDSQLFVWIVFFFYISKYVEYADTFFLLVMQKPGEQISWLQWIHHIGAAVDLWMLHRYKVEAGWIFVFFNGFIHTIMYMYFAFSVYGKKILPRVLITSMQIAQFLTGFYFLYFYKDVPCFANDPYRMLVWYYNYAYVGVILLLFLNFFVQNYLKPAPKSEKHRRE